MKLSMSEAMINRWEIRSPGCHRAPPLTDRKEAGQTLPSESQDRLFTKRAKLAFPWEDTFLYSEQPPERMEEEADQEEGRDEMIARLALADQRTQNMTKEEYAYWSDCRQASFTFRKGKRFRRWVGFERLVESKVSDDVVDVLGFLISEIIQSLTKEALKVKEAEDWAQVKNQAAILDKEAESKGQKMDPCGLFRRSQLEPIPITSKHIQEAFRRLQIVPKKYTFMRRGMAGSRTSLRLI